MEKRLKNLLDNTMSYINGKYAEYKGMPGMKGFNTYLNNCSYEIWQKVQTNTVREDWLLRLNQKMRDSEQSFRSQNGLPRLSTPEYQNPFLVHIMGFDRQLFEDKRAAPSSNHNSSWNLNGTRKHRRHKGDWKSLSIYGYLSDRGIQLTTAMYEMFLFLEYTECFRKRDKQTIKKFCEENSPEKMGVYVQAARVHICTKPEILLQNFDLDTDYSDTVKANSIKLFDYMYNQNSVKMPDDYISLGLTGVLDDLTEE